MFVDSYGVKKIHDFIQAKEAEAERSMKKRKLVEKKQGKSQNSKQKKCSNDSDEDTYGMLVDEGCEVEEENCDDWWTKKIFQPISYQ